MSGSPARTDRALVARSVSKSFGPVQALHGAGIEVRPGTVHALVGENGAGKSTLARILAGVERADEADMRFGGARYAPRDRAHARAIGINMVPQQLSLVGELSLVENLLLVGAERIVSRSRARATLAAVLRRVEVEVALDVPASRLSQAHRQLGEIVIALAEGARVLILDEPTASLGPVEIGGLFEHLRALCALGTAVVLITHRLEEVRAVADDVTVLSHGRVVHRGAAAGLNPAEIARLMVGELPPPRARAEREPGPVVLELEGVSARSPRDADLAGVDLRVRAGEVVGVAGVAGSGQHLLVDVLAGLVRPEEGAVRLAGQELGRGAARAVLEAGVSWIPEERAEALVPEMSLAENLALADRATGRPRAPRPRPEAVEDRLRAFDVRPPRPGLRAGGLSGGNQQKLLVARELGPAGPGAGAPLAVLAYGPTQGLDLRAAQAIRERLLRAAEGGSAVLLASHDLDELLAVCDRIVVLFDGRVVADLPAWQADATRLGEAMAGLGAGSGAPTPTSPRTQEQA